MKVAVLQYDVGHTIDQNLQIIEDFCIKNANDFELLVLPELCLSGYFFKSKQELLSKSQNLDDEVLAKLKQFTIVYNCTIVAGVALKNPYGITETKVDTYSVQDLSSFASKIQIFNTALVLSQGKLIGFYNKKHLTNYEKTFFTPGCRTLETQKSLGNPQVSSIAELEMQDGIFDFNGIKVGIEICFDVWFPELARTQVQHGAQVLLVLGNFGNSTTLVIAKVRAIENVTPLVVCNRVGTEKFLDNDVSFYGGSFATNQNGEDLKRLEQDDEGSFIIDLPVASQIRSNLLCHDFSAEWAMYYAKT